MKCPDGCGFEVDDPLDVIDTLHALADWIGQGAAGITEPLAGWQRRVTGQEYPPALRRPSPPALPLRALPGLDPVQGLPLGQLQAGRLAQ